MVAASKLLDVFMQCHEKLEFKDVTGGSAIPELQLLTSCVDQSKSDLKMFRATFIELVLVLAFQKRPDDPENAVKMIRDQCTALSSQKDGVMSETDIHPALYSEASNALM